MSTLLQLVLLAFVGAQEPVQAQAPTAVCDRPGTSVLVLDVAIPERESAAATARALAQRTGAAWAGLARGTRAASNLWILFHPGAIVAGPVQVREGIATQRFSIRLAPEVSFTAPPVAASVAAPPAVRGEAGAAPAELCLRSAFPLLLVELALGEHMHDQDFSFEPGVTAKVRGIRMKPEGARLHLLVELSPPLGGTVDVAGTPRFEPSARALVLTGVTVGYPASAQVSPQSVEAMRARLEGNPLWKLSTDLGYTGNKLEDALAAALGAGARVEVPSVTLEDLAVAGDVLQIRARVLASASVRPAAAP